VRVTFLDVMDGSIVNVALPTICTHLVFSVQNLQWVVSGYLITYGGFLLLDDRARDLLGRQQLLIAGTALFAASSLACGLASSQGLLVGARLGPLSYDAAHNRWKKYCAAAGVTIGIHQLRHAHATELQQRRLHRGRPPPPRPRLHRTTQAYTLLADQVADAEIRAARRRRESRR
jgi:MFS family permease